MASTKKLHKKSKKKLIPKAKPNFFRSLQLFFQNRILSNFKNTGWQKNLIKPYVAGALSILTIFMGTTLVFMGATNSLGLDWKHPFINHESIEKTAKVQPKPVTLYIPKLNRTLPITDGKVVNDRWTISQSGVSYLVTSASPGTNGNSVIYGHNLANILGDLYLLSNGDTVYVVLNTGSVVKYQIFEEKEVNPQSVEILDPSTDSRLTVYTCSGFLDSARFVVVAKQTNFI